VKERGRGLWGTDPPKPIADIVEAILGSIHVHGGFFEGQQAAEKILEPVRNLLEQTNDLNKILRYPKRNLLEVGGKLTSLTTVEECEFAKEAINRDRAWLGKEWGPVQGEGHRHVATVQCLGANLISLVDDTPSSASNRACAFVLSALDNKPELFTKFRALRTKVSQASNEIAAEGEGDTSRLESFP